MAILSNVHEIQTVYNVVCLAIISVTIIKGYRDDCSPKKYRFIRASHPEPHVTPVCKLLRKSVKLHIATRLKYVLLVEYFSASPLALKFAGHVA